MERKQSKYYQEFNPNPLGKEVGDCVIRSLCAVTNKSWYEIYDILSECGRKMACPFTHFELENIDYPTDLFGMTRCKLKREKGKKAMDVKRFCEEHPTGKYLLRCAHHYMGIVDGKYYELYAGWENATVYTYWEVK